MPAMTARAYAGGVQSILNKEVDVDSDTLKVTLHTATYTPDFDTDRFVADLTNQLSTAGGYTSGGATVTGTLAKTAANSWAQVAAVSTAYTVGQVVRPSTGNGFLYVCSVAGTTAGSAPTWPTTLYREVTDGSVVWTAIGRGAVTLDITDPTWAAFTAGPFRHAVLADYTPGTDAARPLLACFSYASDQTGGGGSHVIAIDASGALVLPY